MYTIGGNEIREISISFISNIYHLLVLRFKVFVAILEYTINFNYSKARYLSVKLLKFFSISNIDTEPDTSPFESELSFTL